MSHAETLKVLASITDTGLFERLATAVLREANPLYESLIHTGVNAGGQTIKGPLDGVAFIRGAEPPHMISVHHATGDRHKLRKNGYMTLQRSVPKKQMRRNLAPVIFLKQLKSIRTRELEPPIL